MKELKIEWLSDTSDCDTCGTSWADGARVWLDDELIVDLEPCASCYGGDHYSEETVYKTILENLGYTLRIST